MSIEQVRLVVPAEIEARIAAGEWVRYGSVVRDSTGRIVKHLNETQAGARSFTHFKALLSPRGLAIVGIASAVVIGVAAVRIVGRRQRRLSTEVASSTSGGSLETPVANYLAQARGGSLSLDGVDRALESVRALRDEVGDDESNRMNEIAVIEALLPYVYDFTHRLASANAMYIDIKDPSLARTGRETVELFVEYLEVQKEVFGSHVECGLDS